MTTITLKVPDEVAAGLSEMPADLVEAYAVETLAVLARDQADVIAAVKEGMADVDAGRTIALEDYIQQVHEKRRLRDAAR
jgi:predicted transcriptional regulator